MEKKVTNKFNWKLVIIAIFIIGIAYFAVSALIAKSKMPPRKIVYCYFNVSLKDSIPRDECGILKIISRDIDSIGIEEFKRFANCSNSLDELPACEGKSYHFSKYNLKEFCENPDCNTDGVICSAFFIIYHNDMDSNREIYEKMFTEPNIASREELMSRIEKCKV